MKQVSFTCLAFCLFFMSCNNKKLSNQVSSNELNCGVSNNPAKGIVRLKILGGDQIPLSSEELVVKNANVIGTKGCIEFEDRATNVIISRPSAREGIVLDGQAFGESRNEVSLLSFNDSTPTLNCKKDIVPTGILSVTNLFGLNTANPSALLANVNITKRGSSVSMQDVNLVPIDRIFDIEIEHDGFYDLGIEVYKIYNIGTPALKEQCSLLVDNQVPTVNLDPSIVVDEQSGALLLEPKELIKVTSDDLSEVTIEYCFLEGDDCTFITANEKTIPTPISGSYTLRIKGLDQAGNQSEIVSYRVESSSRSAIQQLKSSSEEAVLAQRSNESLDSVLASLKAFQSYLKLDVTEKLTYEPIVWRALHSGVQNRVPKKVIDSGESFLTSALGNGSLMLGSADSSMKYDYLLYHEDGSNTSFTSDTALDKMCETGVYGVDLDTNILTMIRQDGSFVEYPLSASDVLVQVFNQCRYVITRDNTGFKLIDLTKDNVYLHSDATKLFAIKDNNWSLIKLVEDQWYLQNLSGSNPTQVDLANYELSLVSGSGKSLFAYKGDNLVQLSSKFELLNDFGLEGSRRKRVYLRSGDLFSVVKDNQTLFVDDNGRELAVRYGNDVSRVGVSKRYLAFSLKAEDSIYIYDRTNPKEVLTKISLPSLADLQKIGISDDQIILDFRGRITIFSILDRVAYELHGNKESFQSLNLIESLQSIIFLSCSNKPGFCDLSLNKVHLRTREISKIHLGQIRVKSSGFFSQAKLIDIFESDAGSFAIVPSSDECILVINLENMEPIDRFDLSSFMVEDQFQNIETDGSGQYILVNTDTRFLVHDRFHNKSSSIHKEFLEGRQAKFFNGGVVTYHWDQHARYYELNSTFTQQVGVKPIEELQGVTSFEVSNLGKTLSSVNFEGKILNFDEQMNYVDHLVPERFEGRPQSISFSSDGLSIYLGLDNGYARVDQESGRYDQVGVGNSREYVKFVEEGRSYLAWASQSKLQVVPRDFNQIVQLLCRSVDGLNTDDTDFSSVRDEVCNSVK
ncbi:hypothetical protein [Pseudobacteriovorax antillogorgiicola]|uniref:Uncharacterized protein n=1 Tax=Pseudobacteriovorax antillogorgiicola TaxID=1513793 RepID=A0A1Y6CIK7_9BACT|nr:hypothetical protein [Pseudobacteriovorax antillogorgiicola]TCS48302.1 hypothetical protein EDD56_11882 [Pseudobacteriovorax antillogorgiicola]SMF56781.1 hypothetical protein SAMN06296036_11859 [Pseudobacteriovorax antillogorgiicola]